MTLFYYVVTTNWVKVCALLFVINHMRNGDLLSLVYPVSLFIYTLLENPFAPKAYWNFMLSYTIIIILLKFIYQLPIFCGTPPYSIISITDGYCDSFSLNVGELLIRKDYIIGIRKYNGPSSYPLNEGFFFGVIWDYLILLSLFTQKYIMLKLGIWDYLILSGSLFRVP